MIIMDFDGVVADSHGAILKAINDLAVKRNKPQITDAEYASVSMRSLFAKLALPKILTPYYVNILRKGIRTHFDELGLHTQILPVLEWAQQTQTPLGILSSNATDVIRRFVDAHLPEVPFASVQGNCALWAKHRYLKKIAQRHGSSVERSVYLGDETRDIDAARRVGMRSVAVTWGKDSAHLLEQSGPSCLAQDGSAVVRYLGALAARAA